MPLLRRITTTTTTTTLFPRHPIRPTFQRPFQTSSSPRRLAPAKASQDKDSINTDSTEYSKSGGDAEAAHAADDAAFDPSKTSPEAEHESARAQTGGNRSNPLNVSPANPDVSKPRGEEEGGAQGSEGETGQGGQRARTSGGGSPAKGRET